MVKVLERALEELSSLSPERQREYGQAILGVLHAPLVDSTEEEEAEWDELTSRPESQAFLDHMIARVDASIAEGKVYPDPADLVSDSE